VAVAVAVAMTFLTTNQEPLVVQVWQLLGT
jgi:hypothetical protein